MQAQLGEKDWMQLEKALDEPPAISIRKHPLKTVRESLQLPITSSVLWNQQGAYLSERPIFTLDPVFHAGGYYVQEASSMFLRYALEQLEVEHKDLRILDLCAAPGGKSTLIASYLNGNGLLVANEVIKTRVGALYQNLSKWGYSNTVVTNRDSSGFQQLNGFFDRVVVDAPCSGEGLFRKDKAAVAKWSPEAVEHCAARQQRILENAMALVRPNGYLIYSTCTYNRLENDQNIAWLQQQFGAKVIELHPPKAWQIVETEYGYQFYPHLVKGEGFYLAVVQKIGGETASLEPSIPKKKRKKNNKPPLPQIQTLSKTHKNIVQPWLKTPEEHALLEYKQNIYALPERLQLTATHWQTIFPYSPIGTAIGTIKGSDFIPSHELALSNLCSENIPTIELDKDNALIFLRKNIPTIPPNTPKGWVLVRYQGLNLGWIKVLSNRINNYLPKNWRILMRT